MAQHGNAPGGFSLIEVMIIVVVVAVLAVVAVPNFTQWTEREKLKAGARAVSDAFLFARSEALRTGSDVLVVFDSALGAPSRLVVVDDGPQATANCVIEAGEVLHSVEIDPAISFGTTQATARISPDDEGGAAANFSNGSTFTDAGGVNPATWVLFRSDGVPRTFTPGSPCVRGNVAAGGGGVYVTDGERDYGVVLHPLGASRVHRWQPDGGWSS